jgi:hypothetical protein
LNSLPAEPRFAALLETSLAVLSRECPEAYAEICRMLAGYEVAIVLDTEKLALCFEEDGPVVRRSAQQPTVHFIATRHTLLDLIDAKFTLEFAITRDILHVRGKMNALIQFYEALRLYIHGAVRSPSFPALLSDYRYRNLSSG